MLRCKFEKDGQFKTVEVPELCFIRDGFWINHKGKFTQGLDCMFYIMPHMIREIKKIGQEGFETYKMKAGQVITISEEDERN